MASGNPRTDDSMTAALVRLNARILGGVLAVLCGGGLVLVTGILVWQGGPRTGQMLGLLVHLLPGFSISLSGAVAGGIGAAVLGYGVGLCVGRAYGPWLLREGEDSHRTLEAPERRRGLPGPSENVFSPPGTPGDRGIPHA